MQKIVRTITLAYNNLPRPHRVMLGSLTVVTLAVAVWRPSVYHPESEYSPITKTVELESNQLRSIVPEASEPLDTDQAIPDDEIPQDELDQKVSGDEGVHEYVVSTGDTLGSILTQYGIEMSDVSLLASQYRDLRNLKIGQQLSWTLNAAGDLQQLTWEVSRRETRTYERVGNAFKETKENQKGEWRNTVLSGKLNGSFVSSANAAGLTRAEINAVIKALQWQLDFRKLRKGDQFAVLMSREEFDGKSEQSQLLGVHFRSSGKDYYAIRAEDGKFYDRQGSGLARGFMRFPTMKQFRISSNFNPRRVNPVTGRIAPHKGVDFAMPAGTPVLAVGDGEVVIAKRSGAAGNYVAIRHGRQYTTRYMHLKKLLVKPGQKVKRGDRIALSGNTGRSTGPHLHYELWTNQQAVNPLTAKLPRSEGLSGKDRSDYLEQVKEVVPQLQID
ncbi:murein DD-endopeptidase MepM [Serratia sp. UGAL515B_01]|uniref:murein DD-endopeptidase MepM n=1 Tax=Serratia sp. UGAL515B_01 TaxID=2986763 RepID=UPI0029543BFE|nr:murein DD-endopeptidase MepM [Serratia sp. UGAL515B_01]WON78376.1 murein DD-endopeptidase MepM [Serratia sp. UGAL515B_01]